MYEGNGGGYDSHRQQPLPWATEKTIRKGAVELQVTSAVGRNGNKLFSWSLSRVAQDSGRSTKHLRKDDIGHVEEALRELADFFGAAG